MSRYSPQDLIIKDFERFRNDLENQTTICIGDCLNIEINGHFYGYLHSLDSLMSFLDWVFSYLPKLECIEYKFNACSNFIPENPKINKLRIVNTNCLQNITIYSHITILSFTNLYKSQLADLYGYVNKLENIILLYIEVFKTDVNDILESVHLNSDFIIEGQFKIDISFPYLPKTRLKFRRNNLLVKSASKI
jgi:hypothetical protein